MVDLGLLDEGSSGMQWEVVFVRTAMGRDILRDVRR